MAGTRPNLHGSVRAVYAGSRPLTRLPNRALLEDRLETSLAQTARHGSLIGLIFCDIKRFKRINDGPGHGAGASVLRHVAAQLVAAVQVHRFPQGDRFTGRSADYRQTGTGGMVVSSGS